MGIFSGMARTGMGTDQSGICETGQLEIQVRAGMQSCPKLTGPVSRLGTQAAVPCLEAELLLFWET